MIYNAVVIVVVTVFVGLMIGFLFHGRVRLLNIIKVKLIMKVIIGCIILVTRFYNFTFINQGILTAPLLMITLVFITTNFPFIPFFIIQVNIMSEFINKYIKINFKYLSIILVILLMINVDMALYPVQLKEIITYNSLFLISCVFSVLIHNLFNRYNDFYHTIRDFATIDQASNLYNHVYFDNHFAKLITKQSFAIVDIDLLKNYEELYGYTITNKIMQELSQIIFKRLKDVGTVFRYNSDEFYVLFEHNEEEKCFKRIQQLKDEIEHLRFSIENNTIRLTVSIGLKINSRKLLVKEMVLDSQQALKQSKILGRNKITVA